jgi:hypothetical protein
MRVVKFGKAVAKITDDLDEPRDTQPPWHALSAYPWMCRGEYG